MKDIVIQAAPWGIATVPIVLPALVALVKREQIVAAIRRALPDGALEDLAVRAAQDAYKVVEQKTRKLAAQSDEERLALAKQIAAALLDFYQHHNLSDLAREALIELEVWAQHQGASTPVSGEAVPLAEKSTTP